MKKILSIVTVMAVTLSACFISAFSSVLSAAEEVPFKSLYTFTLADTDLGYELRGLAASQDGEYLYAGFLQNTRNVLKIDAADGSIVDAYTPAIPEISLDIDRYPKGLATDDRGNLFVGITHAENGNNHMLTLAAVRQSDMTEISYITDTVAEAGTAIGVNGITVVKQGDRYLCYAAICYSNYSIRCYDVTDPENITLYSGFASDGVLSTGFSPYYLAADGMGNVYVTGVENSIYGVYKINASGEILAQATVNRAYGIVLKDTHILISSSGNDGTITLLDTGLNILGQYTVSGLSGNFVQSAIGGDTVYIADCGNGEEAGGIAGAVYAAPVSVMDGDKVNISALKADKTPEIDGSLADDVWKGGFVTYTDESYGKPLQFKFVWDDDNLYLAAKMIDVTPFCNTDKIFKDEAGAAADAAYSFQYDCLEFYFSGKNTEGEYADDDVQFIFTYQTDGAPALRVGGSGNQAENYAAGKYAQVRTACETNASGWNFEAAVPWTALGVTDLTSVFGISVKQNDDYPEDTAFDKGTYISYGDAQWNIMTGNFTLSLSTENASEKSGEPKALSAEKSGAELQIDGELNEAVWNGGFYTYTDEATGKPLQLKYAWDKQNIYFAAKMIDTTPFYSSDKAFADGGNGEIYTFQYDALEFYFSASNRKGAYADGDIQLIFTYQEDGKPVIAAGASGSQREDLAAGKFDNIKSACTTTDFGWYLEISIPWETLGVDELSDVFGITVKQNDDFSGDTSLDQGMYISYGDSTWDNMTGNYTLTAAGGSGRPDPAEQGGTEKPGQDGQIPDDGYVTPDIGGEEEEPSTDISGESGNNLPTTGSKTVLLPAVVLLIGSLAVTCVYVIKRRRA